MFNQCTGLHGTKIFFFFFFSVMVFEASTVYIYVNLCICHEQISVCVHGNAILDLLFPFHFCGFTFFFLSTEGSNFKGPGIKECIFVAWPSWNGENNNGGGNNLARSETRIKDSCMCCFKYCRWQHCWATCSSQVSLCYLISYSLGC